MKKKKHIIIAVLVLVIIIPLGFYSKLYNGIGQVWINNKLGGIFYEIFWCLVFYILIPNSKLLSIAAWIFIMTCILEFIQLVDNSFLDIIRSNYIGRTIIGNSFSWSDFPYYFIGSFLGFFLLKLINKSNS